MIMELNHISKLWPGAFFNAVKKGKYYPDSPAGLMGDCVVPEKIHTYPTKGHWNFQEGVGSQKPKILKESMKLNRNFQRGGELVQTKRPSTGEIWIFSGTMHSHDTGLWLAFTKGVWMWYGQQICCFDSCQLATTWMSNIKLNKQVNVNIRKFPSVIFQNIMRNLQWHSVFSPGRGLVGFPQRKFEMGTH